MIFSRAIRNTVGRVIVATLLVAYAFNAAHACVASKATPATAFQNSDAGDCEAMNAPNICLQHCTSNDQNAGYVVFIAIATSERAALILPRQARSSTPILVTLGESKRSPDPPPSIRFCSFQL